MRNEFIQLLSTRKQTVTVGLARSPFYHCVQFAFHSTIYVRSISTGYKPEGITYPSGAMQQKLLSEFYDEIKIDPSTLAYVEAHR